jgi:hypothetical protein
LEMRSQEVFCLGWPWASQVARITGVSHWRPALFIFWWTGYFQFGAIRNMWVQVFVLHIFLGSGRVYHRCMVWLYFLMFLRKVNLSCYNFVTWKFSNSVAHFKIVF